jgi:transcriptional regulator with XRE-family HTH domain
VEAAVSAVVVPRLWDGTKLRTWREEAGLTPTQAAAANNMSVAWLYAIENNAHQKQPGADTLILLCRFYGHEVAELIIPAEAVAAQAAS